MPSLITKRGKKRWRGYVQLKYVIQQKLFPDDSKKSHKTAVMWENETRKQLEKELAGTHSVSWQVIDWANGYLEDAQERFAKKTFQEKRSAFSNLLQSVTPEMPLDSLNPSICLKHLRKQAKSRSGNSANKDRKNLGVAWGWGKKYLVDFPHGINPFLAVDKFPEQRSPRYIPPEEDFWTVYEAAEVQDKVMLMAFLHLAARRNEIFGLTWEDIDFGNIRVRLWTHKRKGGHREADWLPMTKELRKTLMQWWQDRPVKDTPYVFVCLEQLPCIEDRYGKPYVERSKFMRRLCEKAGVKPFGYHAIRHLTASILYQKGQSVGFIQAVLRHKSPNTTTIYLQSLGIEHVRDGLDESLKGPAKIIEFKRQITNE